LPTQARGRWYIGWMQTATGCVLALAAVSLSTGVRAQERVGEEGRSPQAPKFYTQYQGVSVPSAASPTPAAPTRGNSAPPTPTAPTPAAPTRASNSPTPPAPTRGTSAAPPTPAAPTRGNNAPATAPPTPAAPQSSPAAPPPSQPAPVAASDLPSSSDTSQITSLSNPIWVTPPTQGTAPSAAAAPAQVSVPELPAAPPPPAAPPARTAANSSDLVVIATDVQIVGADDELQDLIRRTIATQVGGEVSNPQLQQDVALILKTALFSQASYSTKANPDGVSVTFQVTPIVVRSLRLSGAQVLTQEVANQLFQPLIGKTINLTELQQAVERTNQWYAQQSYTLARVLSVEPSREGVLTINVAEGQVGDIQIRFQDRNGNAVDEKGNPIRGRTQEAFIRRQIKLQPGQPFREEVAREDLRRLSALGIFDSATITFEGDANRTTVVYNLVEGKARGFNFGGGYNDDLGIYATVTYQDTNFGGLGQRASASVQAGLRDIQFDTRFVSPYRDTEPGMPGYGVNLYRRRGLSRVFDDEIYLPNGSRVREYRLGGGAFLEYPVAQGWMGNLGVNYVNVSTRDKDGDIFSEDEEGNPLTLSGTGVDDLYSVSLFVTRDKRDNPINPGRGSLLTFGTEQYIPIGRGNVLGNRLTANYSQFIPIDWFKNEEGEKFFPEVFALNVQGGTFIGDLPPYNAFTMGGVNSVRGYGNEDLATSRSYLQISAEYRFPIYRFIGGVLFTDFGTDLGTSDDVLGEPGVVRDKPGTGFGFGTGLRVNTPIGIIRADFGVTNQGDARFQFGFGQKF